MKPNTHLAIEYLLAAGWYVTKSGHVVQLIHDERDERILVSHRTIEVQHINDNDQPNRWYQTIYELTSRAALSEDQIVHFFALARVVSIQQLQSFAQ